MEFFVVLLQVIFFVGLSAICSGLNIALMSLSKRDLKHKVGAGNKMAERVLPFRMNSHLSLAAILFTNVAAVSANALILEHHFNGLVAGLVSTVLIVIFGEVLPQAVFVKSALVFVSTLTPLVWLMVIVTYPLAKPLQLVLDKIIGDENSPLHSRAELGMLISEHKIGDESELDEDEVEIIESTLLLSEKQVEEIMQPIDDVYWLPDDTVLDAKTVDEIKEQGYSRVPIFNKKLTQCRGVLLMKDMVDVDFDERSLPVNSFYLHQTTLIGSKTALDTTLRKFFSLHTHLAPVVKNKKIVGIVTIEDLFEEIIGHEIMDETDRKLSRN